MPLIIRLCPRTIANHNRSILHVELFVILLEILLGITISSVVNVKLTWEAQQCVSRGQNVYDNDFGSKWTVLKRLMNSKQRSTLPTVSSNLMTVSPMTLTFFSI